MLDITEYCKRCVADEFKNMLDIIYLYYKLDDIHDFVLDLQLYEGSYKETEPRIWLSAPDNHMGIRLMLYSVKLKSCDEIVPNEKAIEVFSEYMKFYSENQELFKLWHDETDNYQPTASITFEVSNRGR